MNKLDKQILKIINKANVDCGTLINERVVSQINAVYLKAITKELNKLMDNKRIGVIEGNLKIYSRGWDRTHCPMCGASPSEQKKMILSVIKKVLK